MKRKDIRSSNNYPLERACFYEIEKKNGSYALTNK